MKKITAVFATVCCVIMNAQTYQWAMGIGGTVGTNNPNEALCVATDGAGNVYTTGHFRGTNVNFNPGGSPVNLSSGSTTDIFFAKYTTGGNCTWANSIFASAGIGKSITTDAGGNVYITGSFSGVSVDFDPGLSTATLSSNNDDIFIAKYNSAGNYLWAKAMGGSGNEIANSINVDATGNTYITGRFQSTSADFDPGVGTALLSSAGGHDIFFAKYDANGNYLWAKSVGSPGNDVSYSISADASGNAYITGSFQGGATDFDPGSGSAPLSSGGTEIFFAKYDTNGNYLWARSISGSSAGSGQSISADAAGSILITGGFQGVSVDFDPGLGSAILSAGPSSSNTGMFFGKYDSNGNYLWAKAVGGAGAGGYGIARNSSGKVYLIGQFGPGVPDFDPGPGTATLSSTGSNKIFFAKYDATGNYIWAKSLSGIYYDYGKSIAVDGSDNVFIAGVFGGTCDFDVGPGTATIVASPVYSMYLAKYAYCSALAMNSQTVCSGSSYAINGHTYTANGTYNDTIHTAFGCDSIVVTQLTMSGQQPTVTISSSSVLCIGSSNTLTATGAVTYTWSNGAQTPVVIVTPTSTSAYTVAGTGSVGCTANNTINVLTAPSLSINGRQNICKGEQIIITASGANNYIWNSGAQTTSINIAPTTTTVYTVVSTFTNLCKSQKTVTVTVMPCLGVSPNGTGDVKITVYPNPAKTELFYTVNNSDKHRYTLTDFGGTLVAEGEQRGSKVRLDLSTYPAGIYNITITVGKYSASKRFIIEKTE